MSEVKLWTDEAEMWCENSKAQAMEIFSLRAEVERLRAALIECMNQHHALRSEALRLDTSGISSDFVIAQTSLAIRRARAALNKGGEG